MKDSSPNKRVTAVETKWESITKKKKRMRQ